MKFFSRLMRKIRTAVRLARLRRRTQTVCGWTYTPQKTWLFVVITTDMGQTRFYTGDVTTVVSECESGIQAPTPLVFPRVLTLPEIRHLQFGGHLPTQEPEP